MSESSYYTIANPDGAERLMDVDAKTTALVLIDLQQGVLAMPVMPQA